MLDFGIFTQPFMVHAWVCGTIVAISSSFMGYFIIIRSVSFTAHVLPEIGFSGGAGAILISLNPMWGLISFSIAGAFLIENISRKESSDITTSLTLVSTVGLGSLFLSLNKRYAEGAYALLFGQIAGVSSSQMTLTGMIAIGGLVCLAIIYRPLVLCSISPEIAQTKGISIKLVETIFLLTIAFSTAIMVPIVGALLCFGLLIAPNAASLYFTSNPKLYFLLSLIFSLLNIWFSIFDGYITGYPIGFFVTVNGALIYAVARINSRIKNR